MATVNNATNYGANQTAGWWAGKTWYAALMTTKTSKVSNGVEVSEDDYDRVAVTLVAKGGSDHGVIINTAAVEFGTPATNWGTVVGVTLFDEATGGNAWFFYDLVAGVGAVQGAPLSIPVNHLVQAIS